MKYSVYYFVGIFLLCVPYIVKSSEGSSSNVSLSSKQISLKKLQYNENNLQLFTYHQKSPNDPFKVIEMGSLIKTDFLGKQTIKGIPIDIVYEEDYCSNNRETFIKYISAGFLCNSNELILHIEKTTSGKTREEIKIINVKTKNRKLQNPLQKTCTVPLNSKITITSEGKINSPTQLRFSPNSRLAAYLLQPKKKQAI